MAGQQSPNRDAVDATLDWIVANPIPSLTILGAVAYLAYRVAFLIYYDRFAVTPEEVGLDYVGILTNQAAGGLLEILLVVGIAFLFRRTLARIEGTLESESAYSEALGKLVRRLSWSIKWIIVGFPIFFLVLAVTDAVRAGDGARDPTITEPFQGRAIPVVALWIDPPGEDSKPRAITYTDLGDDEFETPTPVFLLLGTSDGVLVLYDRHLGAVRLPRDQVMLVSSKVP